MPRSPYFGFWKLGTPLLTVSRLVNAVQPCREGAQRDEDDRHAGYRGVLGVDLEAC